MSRDHKQQLPSNTIHNTLVSSINSKLNNNNNNDSNQLFTIFRIPAHVRLANGDLYNPKIVSIGPYHRGASDLRAMEAHKWSCFRSLVFCQEPFRRNHVVSCSVELALQLEPSARACYWESETCGSFNSGEFAEMLLLDCCFIIDFLINGRDVNHPVWRVSWNFALVKSDLLLVENQIPFFVLQSVYDLLVRGFEIDCCDKTQSLIDLVTEFFELKRPVQPFSGEQICHLLHLYHFCYIPARSNKGKNVKTSRFCLSLRRSTMSKSVKTIPCATRLKESGVRFKQKESSCSFMAVSFHYGTLEIPSLSIENSTRFLLANLVAFEQCLHGCSKALTSYAVFMNSLISTPADIAVLCKYGIIENLLASDAVAAEFFNELCGCAYLDYDDSKLAAMNGALTEYYHSRWPKWRAKLVREYFGSPWTVLSVAAGLLLLALTVAQTVFAAISYFHPPS